MFVRNSLMEYLDLNKNKRKGEIIGVSLEGNLEIKMLDTKETLEIDFHHYGLDIQNNLIKAKIPH
jgi:hypothetical protein